jgi:hypothetical protein
MWKTILLFAGAMAFFTFVNLRFNKVHVELMPLLSVADLVDLFMPYCLIVFYWSLFSRHGAKSATPSQSFRFVVVAMLWTQGHALHNAANSIANLLESSGQHVRQLNLDDCELIAEPLPALQRLYGYSAADVVDFIDERLSHVLWTLGIALLEALVLGRAADGFQATSPHRRERVDIALPAWRVALMSVASLAYAAAFFGSAVEGQTVGIALTFSVGVVLLFAVRWRQTTARSDVLVFFTATAIIMLVAFGVYALQHWPFLVANGRLPEFSECTNIFRVQK